MVIGRSTHPHPPLIESIIGGELFLISAAIAADAVGRAFLGGTDYGKFRLCCGAGCLISLVGTSLYFMKIADGQRQGRVDLGDAIQQKSMDAVKKVNTLLHGDEGIAADSIILFGFTVLSAFGAILVEVD